MKITEIRTSVVEWRGPTVPPQPHFCTNPMDLLAMPADSMASFRFHGWLIVEVFTDAGHVGIGNAALAPRLTKQTIDVYLEPLLIGRDPHEVERLWEQMFRLSDHAGYGGAEMRAISALDIALWDIKGQALGVPVYELLGGAVRRRVPVYATGMPYEGAAELARQLLDEGITAMKGGPTIPLALASDGQHLAPDCLGEAVEDGRQRGVAVVPEVDLVLDAQAGVFAGLVDRPDQVAGDALVDQRRGEGGVQADQVAVGLAGGEAGRAGSGSPPGPTRREPRWARRGARAAARGRARWRWPPAGAGRRTAGAGSGTGRWVRDRPRSGPG